MADSALGSLSAETALAARKDHAEIIAAVEAKAADTSVAIPKDKE